MNFGNYITATDSNSSDNIFNLNKQIEQNQRIATVELNYAEKLKKQINEANTNSFVKLIFEECAVEIEKLNDNLIELKAISDKKNNQNNLKEIEEFLNSINQKYKSLITKIKKYNTKITKQMFEETKKKNEKLFKIINLFLDEENKIIPELVSKTQYKLDANPIANAIDFYNKGNNLIEQADMEHNNEFINNKYDRARYNFEQAIQTYKQNKHNLKNLFINKLNPLENYNLKNNLQKTSFFSSDRQEKSVNIQSFVIFLLFFWNCIIFIFFIYIYKHFIKPKS
ncbi:hypothetical protein [Candidatus Phytoplasma melaleucae]|uniref:Uncharacterized protein n=1 Tax=Candidatus Phytoplasma melaleucae TaxID=2982630 RepID=A0ABT9DCP0_9MOLU|nr:hypothetical protein ['Melaleuca sp.' phytoplasma]MDO8167896.1 hypothetical protein ['Melaleuca sp.' phytoplasma]